MAEEMGKGGGKKASVADAGLPDKEAMGKTRNEIEDILADKEKRSDSVMSRAGTLTSRPARRR